MIVWPDAASPPLLMCHYAARYWRQAEGLSAAFFALKDEMPLRR